jgi:hypothetical protein
MFTVEAPEGVVNPAEVPVAAAVLEAACYEIHPPENHNRLFGLLAHRHPNLQEEIHYLMRPQQPVGVQAVMRVA